MFFLQVYIYVAIYGTSELQRRLIYYREAVELCSEQRLSSCDHVLRNGI